MKRYRVLLLLSCVLPAQAGQVILDTLGSSILFDPAAGWHFGRALNSISVAAGFHSGPDVRLAKIELALEYVAPPPGLPRGPADIDVTIALDGGNQPGAILETIHSLGVFGGVPNSVGIVTAESALHPLLPAGPPVWLSLSVPASGVADFAWLNGTFGVFTPFSTRRDDNPWVTLPIAPAPAFRITAADVPEPATWMYAAAGSVVFGLLRRLKLIEQIRILRESLQHAHDVAGRKTGP